MYNAYNGIRVDKRIKRGETRHFINRVDAFVYSEQKRSYLYPIIDEKGNLSYGVPK